MTYSIIKRLKEKYRDNYKTESLNSAILELYDVILSHENTDSEYWTGGYASNDVINIIERRFTNKERIELNVDLENWTPNQLELFTQAILRRDYYSEIEIFNLTKSMNHLELILKLIEIEKKITKKISRSYDEISYHILEGIDFINYHFKILIKSDINNFSKIKKIVELLKIDQREDDESIKLIEKIKSYEEKQTL
ncbi:hypothetical protein [Pedobacter helvus]|uniref:Uncharacterized protein n=1 Tax=Pedobacter helvus TaxID=2563444 RepID=A0ABW9JFK1_9SPHI|nr:hypothetical protein [Pedobacter ureilyticus]